MRKFAQLNLFTFTKILQLLVFPPLHIRGLETILLETYEMEQKNQQNFGFQISFIGF